MTEFSDMKKVLLFFNKKYKNDWDSVYDAIKSREQIAPAELLSQNTRDNECIAIVDNDYPNNLKSIYMPPLLIFYYGIKKILQDDKKIISLWGSLNLKDFQHYFNDKKFIYALEYNKNNVDLIQNCQGYKFILVDTLGGITADKKLLLTKLQTNNEILYLTEIDDLIQNENKSRQNAKRFLFGISAKKILVSDLHNNLNDLIQINAIEKTKLFVLDSINLQNDKKMFTTINKINDFSN